ncbi:hypothetical protein [Pseudoalteromonas sp.]|uniref:hypothetical protein n=1 Tax=Pseudoalteromonas sp. TaxID=53249 RepID=UPI003D2BE124
MKKKFLLNFQGFQAELDSEEDFLSCIQGKKETLLNFNQRFLQMKAQALEVSDNQTSFRTRSIKGCREASSDGS